MSLVEDANHIPKTLKRLSRACRDFAEMKAAYTDFKELAKDVRLALQELADRQERIQALERRINEIRNSRETLLVEMQDVMKKFDFTLRSI
jgi:chromosome segregation ATPase